LKKIYAGQKVERFKKLYQGSSDSDTDDSSVISPAFSPLPRITDESLRATV
jgi:hypothetical protein